MKLQQVEWPPVGKQFEAWLDFLNDPKKYAKLQDALKANVDTLNARIKKLGVASDVDRALSEAKATRTEAEGLLAKAKAQVKETLDGHAVEQTRAKTAMAEVVEQARKLKKEKISHAAHVLKQTENLCQVKADLVKQQESAARAMDKAKALQAEAQEAIARIKEFKVAV